MARKLKTVRSLRPPVIAKPLASHPCAHDDCERMIDLESFACLKHWTELAETFHMQIGEGWADEHARGNLVIEANETWRGGEG